MRICIAFALAAMLAACVTPTEHHTASGKPEVTIPGATPDRVKAELVNGMLNGGYRITKDTPYEIAFDRSVQNMAAAVLLGSRYDAQPNARVSYTFAQVGTSVRVVADLAVITNPGSAFERRTEFNNSADSQQVQMALDRVKSLLDPASPAAVARSKGIVLGVSTLPVAQARTMGIAAAPERGLYVTNVVAGSVAERAGVVKGDVLTSYAGRQLSTETDLASALAGTEPGKSVELIVNRSEEEVPIQVRFANSAAMTANASKPKRPKAN